jgi:hypothetical protein
MQLQMEVCDRPSCEFVEVKFKELDADATPTNLHGWITLEGNQDTMDMRYAYCQNPEPEQGWVAIETYQWEVAQLRRVTLQRDPVWFQASQTDLQVFWKDVEAARQGTWIPPPKREKKGASASASAQQGCAIVDSDTDKDPRLIPSYTDSSDSLRISLPVTSAYTEQEIVEGQE